MKTLDLIMVAVLLILLAEVTYVVAKLPRTTLKTKRRAVLVDTSVIMDGRITALASTGFIGDTLVIPRSVVGELQLLADNADTDKRMRARHGLDVVAELQKMPEVDVELLQDSTSASEGVDNRLLSLAKQHRASIMTIDFNLNKVAQVEGIQVLNINDLAQSIRMAHLPGEELMIELMQKGQDNHQAVGYLPDGTMVVVEQSNAFIGKIVKVEIVRSLQTSAGKMIFAKRVGHDDNSNKTQKVRPEGRKNSALLPPKQAAKSRSKATPSPVARQTTDRSSATTPTSSPSTPSRAPKRRSRDREAALISLVENQKD